MSPQLKALFAGLIPLLRMLAGRTQTTVDDAIVNFLELALTNPAAAHAQLVAGQAVQEHIATAAKAPGESPPEHLTPGKKK